MSDIGIAQEAIIDDARVAWHDAIGALGKARGQAETLRDGHLMHDGDFWEAISAIDGMTTLLTELIEELDTALAPAWEPARETTCRSST